MSETTLHVIIVIILIFHGVGHLMGVITAVGMFSAARSSGRGWLRNWSSESWLLTDLLGETAARITCAIIYIAAFVCFISASLGLAGWLVPYLCWRALAVSGAVISLFGIALYWNALILFFPHKVGAILVNAAVLVCSIWKDLVKV